MKQQTHVIPRPALILGLAGLLPFVVSALVIAIADTSFMSSTNIKNTALLSISAYGAVILSFLGGIRWGALLEQKDKLEKATPLAMSIVPSLIAWLALLLPPEEGLLLLIAGVVFQFLLDRGAVTRDELPRWFGRLRLILTGGAVSSMLIALVFIWSSIEIR